MRMRNAQIVAAQVNVLCPYCSEPLYNMHDGSELWLPTEVTVFVRANKGIPVVCNSCEKEYRVMDQNKVTV